MSTIPSIDAIPDSVLFSVSYVNACVWTKITCMVLMLMRSIYAGAYVVEAVVTFVPDQGTVGKNICVLPFVLHQGYARSKRRRTRLRRRLRAETKRFSTPRYVTVRSRMILLILMVLIVFSRFV